MQPVSSLVAPATRHTLLSNRINVVCLIFVFICDFGCHFHRVVVAVCCVHDMTYFDWYLNFASNQAVTVRLFSSLSRCVSIHTAMEFLNNLLVNTHEYNSLEFLFRFSSFFFIIRSQFTQVIYPVSCMHVCVFEPVIKNSKHHIDVWHRLINLVYWPFLFDIISTRIEHLWIGLTSQMCALIAREWQ